MLRRALRASLVEGVQSPPNFSVSINLGGPPAPGRPGGGGTRLNILYRSSTMVVRSRRPRRVVEALASYLSTHGSALDGLLLTVGAAIVGGGRAVIVPNNLMGSFEAIQPRLERAGWRFVDSFLTAIDPDTAEMIVRAPIVAVDPIVLGELDEVNGRGREELPPVPPGRYPVAGWVFLRGSGAEGAMSRAAGVAAAIETVIKEPLGPAHTLHALAQVFTEAVPRSMTFTGAVGAAEALVAVARGVAEAAP